MRRGQQPGMHRTPHTTHDTHSNPRQQAHTHTQPCRNNNTQMEEGEANRSGTQGSTACTYGESGPSCRHPSRSVRTHTRGGAAHTATQKQSNNKKGDPRTPREMLVHGKCSQYSSQKQFSCRVAVLHIQRTTSCNRSHHHSSSRTLKNKRKEWHKASNHLFVFLFGCWQMSACASFCFCGGQTFMPASCVGDSCRVQNYFFSFLL
ncbi:hypothetical protein ECC02_012050 [Trypanosoma cruzi]|uniref:Uncharacterized protein n=1 Tax=Trypanosoma cruzi TaxID=5693 RepID=A0A7J6XN40_TRYCR|nr:hypothetical protein ECC02_012050 [Trypanosoma cruzi]